MAEPTTTLGAGPDAAPSAMPDSGAEPEQSLVRAVEVTRRYGDVTALDRVSLGVRPGELVGLLGPNGAGKSTLINLFCGLRRPTSGRVELLGGSPADPVRRRGIGVTPQETGLPATLRVGEIVDFVSAHYPRSVARGALLERFGLSGLERRQVGGLSGGQKRRLAVALAFVGDPRLVFLDEPTTGLDVEARRALWDAIRDFHSDGGTVVLTSHYLEEVEALAERVVVIGQGRVLADGTTEQVRDIAGVRRVTLTAGDLPELPGVLRTEREGGRTHLLTSDADALVRELVRAGVPFSGLEVRPTSLEEAFLTITAGSEAA
ncbi:ABC transporter ATP-binding protein [Planomonospora parontospora]|uniref:ABC transporter ATP-binding protein n=1 Tax=Planomonospora parontospora TaxID=58119 RepID=UPI001992338A|nr:ABC transporter ATP-binding protein [Planomonospora parontospora]GGL24872.1 ABC transporter ATP-binding protein [Planomonospora parontospora subsp. antibiotica]GII16396.1 ABC transporter ATP-binding protein [Planomonospora parontospora subsp. antibiotica]